MTLRAIGFVGAGIYEEFLFRFLMLPAIYLGLRLVCVPRGFAGLLAILGSSAVFCLAHYWPLDAAVNRDAASAGLASSPLVTLQSVIERIADDPRLWRGCLFRMLAGVVFAIVFVFRGFGIVVGCHALYDIVVGVLLPGLPE
jgi:membrane protease YdiL (CAAX protease family)